MSAPKRVARAAETIRARWERQVSTDPQTEAAQALEDTGQLLDPEVAAELVAFRKARELAEAVAEYGAFPVPVGPKPQAPMPLRAARIRLAQYGERTSTWSTATYNDGTEKALHEIALTLLAEVDRLEAERHSTNAALDDAVRELRARPSCPCPSADQSHQVGCFFDGVPVSPPSERPVNGLTATFMPVASYREDSYTSPLHHDYRKGRDLPLGCGLTDAQVEQLGQPFLDGGA